MSIRFAPASLRALALPILLALIAGASGCTSLAVKLGLLIRLQDIPVTAVSAALVDTRTRVPVAALGPGQSAALVITATDEAGKRYVTTGAGLGKVTFDSFKIDGAIATVSSSGQTAMPSDPRLSFGRTPSLAIAVVGHPGVSTTLEIPVRYDLAYVADHSGAAGASGIDGFPGSDGWSGSNAPPPTVDPVTGVTGPQSAGGNGTDGGAGGDGGTGGSGARGSDVHIWLGIADAGKPLLQAKVVAGTKQAFFVIDPAGGSLRVLANGGRGGAGGAGGRGGRGGSGGQGFPSGFSGNDGRSGSSGSSGSPGAAGTITVTIDPAAAAYQRCLSWQNNDGAGRPGPPAAVVVEAVAPLW